MPDGTILESKPEMIPPPGEIEKIRHELELRTVVMPFGEIESNVFNIFVDAHASTEATASPYIRWRLTGTYKVATRPELHTTFLQQSAYMTPWPCSGYVVEPAMGGGKLVKQGPCHCCTCWIKLYESQPAISDTELVNDGEFRNVKVGEVPITYETFSDTFQLQIEQMPVSRTSYDFFKLIRMQKDLATDLFQPPAGRLIGNITANRSGYQVVGLFWATSLTNATLYFTKDDLPYSIPPIDVIAEPCNVYFANSTTTKPVNWND
jgi:hypothetical protein